MKAWWQKENWEIIEALLGVFSRFSKAKDRHDHLQKINYKLHVMLIISILKVTKFLTDFYVINFKS